MSILLRILAVVAATALMIWLATIAHRRNHILFFLAVMPTLFLAMPSVIAVLRALLFRLAPLRFGIAGGRALLLWMLALTPPIVFYAASYKISVLVPRAFLVFIPYLIVLFAAGALVPFRGVTRLPSTMRWILPAAVCSVFAAGLPYATHKRNVPRDYKELAAAMAEDLRPTDLVLLRSRNWVDTPFFYYLKDGELVVSDYAEKLAALPERRVWLVTWPSVEEPVIPDERRIALDGYKRIRIIERQRAAAELFVRVESQ
jgi:hypothetical protein